jgi:hypothetical protein
MKGLAMKFHLILALALISSTSFGGTIHSDSNSSDTSFTSHSSVYNRVLAVGHNAAIDFLVTGQMTPSLAAAIGLMRDQSDELKTVPDEIIIETLIKLKATDVRLKTKE